MSLAKPQVPVTIHRANFTQKAFQANTIAFSLSVFTFTFAAFVYSLSILNKEAIFISGRMFLFAYTSLFASFLLVRERLSILLKRTIFVLLSFTAIANVMHYWNGAYLTTYGRLFIEEKLELPSAFLLSVLLSFALIKSLLFKKNNLTQWMAFTGLLLLQILQAFFVKSSASWLITSSFFLIILSYTTSITNRITYYFKVKNILIFLIPIVVVLLLSGMQAYQPVHVAGPVITSLKPMPSIKVKGVKLHVFNTGFNRMSKSLSPGTPPWRIAPAFVIEHPTKGLIVFDGGISPLIAEQGEKALPFPMGMFFESRGEENQTLDQQMKRVGLQPEKVAYVILSHFHEDHTGTIHQFPNSQLVIGGNTVPLQVTHYKILDTHSFAEQSSFLGKSIDLFGDNSLILMEGGGHSREDQLLWVNLERGPCLLTGDAVVHFDWLVSSDVERVAVNGEKAAEVRNTIRKLMETNKEVFVFPGHDLPSIQNNRDDITIENPLNFQLTTWTKVKAVER